MKILSWWRKRQGILKKAVEPEYACISINGEYLIIRSCLSLSGVFKEANKTHPPPYGLIWGLFKRDETNKRGFYVYHFRLLEDYYGNQDRRQVAEV